MNFMTLLSSAAPRALLAGRPRRVPAGGPDIHGDPGYRLISTPATGDEGVAMQGFAGKVAVVTGAGFGHRAGAGRRAGPLGRQGGDQRRRHRGPRRRPRSSSKAIGAPVKADRLDVTEREAFLAYADARQRALRQGQPDLQQRRHRVHRRHRGQPVQGHRTGDGRRLLGRRQRHQGVPAAPDRLRRRPRRQRLQRVRAVRRARPGRLQRGEVRRARLHRGAAPGDGRWPAIR